MGYANECGEALRSLLPPFGVPASYAVAIGYVLCDTIDKAKKEWDVSAVCKTDPSKAMRVVRVASSAFDALSWQVPIEVLTTENDWSTQTTAHCPVLSPATARPLMNIEGLLMITGPLGWFSISA